MSQINDLSSDIITTISEENLISMVVNIIDSLSEDILEKQNIKIPLLSNLLAVYKSVNSISDKLFLKKLAEFLKEIRNISDIDRNKWIHDMENSQDSSDKFGEKLLYIIDRNDDSEKATFTGKIFKALLKNQITKDEFFKCCRAINFLSISEIKTFYLIPHKEDVQKSYSYILAGVMDNIIVKPRYQDFSNVTFKQSGTNIKFLPGDNYAVKNRIGNIIIENLF